MTISKWLTQAEHSLRDANVSTARLDALVLLSDITRKDKAWLLSHSDEILQIENIKILNTKIIQRSKHIPLAYIRGHAEFYGRDFTVNPHTLVPRPETEAMIELLKALDLPAKTKIIDVGTGSGCIAITAALELPTAIVSACDIDTECLRVAAQNAKDLRVNVEVYKADILEGTFAADVLLCNLPYVPDDFHINTAATHEPRAAIFGGADGLDLFRRLFEQITAAAWKPSYILTESLPTQHKNLTVIAKAAGFALQKTDDFIQVFTYAN